MHLVVSTANPAIVLSTCQAFNNYLLLTHLRDLFLFHLSHVSEYFFKTLGSRYIQFLVPTVSVTTTQLLL